MAKRVLLTWELGAGLGHLVPLRRLADALIQSGHRVALAAQDLAGAGRLFRGLNVDLWQAPFKTTRSAGDIQPIGCFEHMLHNTGFGDADELGALASAWRALIDAIKPDAVVCDHSPTALLATCGMALKRCQIGTGFFCPPDTANLPRFDGGAPDEQTGARLLNHANAVLEHLGAPPMESIGEIYDTDHAFLITFAELDHYDPRADTDYAGPWVQATGGVAPTWPKGSGKRVFAYLKNFPAAGRVLEGLRSSGHAVLAYGPQLPADILRRAAGPNLAVSDQPVDVSRVAAECDAAVLNGNHATTAQLLLGGVPTVQIPLFVEQKLFADRVADLGAGVTVDRVKAEGFEGALAQAIEDSGCRSAAERFADKHAGFDAEEAIHKASQLITA